MRPPSMAVEGNGGKSASGPSKQAGPDYTLSAIRIGHNQRSAIINDRNVSIGERIGQARVVEIRANGVTLKQNGKEITLPLLPIGIKTPAEANRP